jgi:group I intron endonuclease
MIGIYKITNPRGEVYVGLSKNIELRWQSHKNFQFHKNNKLKESLLRDNIELHIFEVIEEVDISDLRQYEANALLRKRERYWINKLNSFNIGLNENGGGSGCGSHTDESKQKISQSLKGKPKPLDFGAKRKKWQHTDEWKEKVKSAPRCPVLMLKDNIIVQEFPNQQSAADHLGVRKQAIWNMLNGFKNRNGVPIIQVRGYTFKYKEKNSIK